LDENLLKGNARVKGIFTTRIIPYREWSVTKVWGFYQSDSTGFVLKLDSRRRGKEFKFVTSQAEYPEEAECLLC
jgi:hypothetical protein